MREIFKRSAGIATVCKCKRLHRGGFAVKTSRGILSYYFCSYRRRLSIQNSNPPLPLVTVALIDPKPVREDGSFARDPPSIRSSRVIVPLILDRALIGRD